MLELQDVVKRYTGIVAVDKVSMKVEAGTIAALIGPNGAGKSTTFRLICGLLQPDAGQILWNGECADVALPAEQRGFLPEERGLYQSVKVEALLRYWAQLRNLEQSAIPAVLDHWISRLELGSKRHATVGTLSKGNQQKLQLAVCLMHAPKLLLLDEPFSGLDPINQDVVSEILREHAKSGAAILISAHQLALVERLADTVTLMHSGRTADMSAFGRAGGRSADTRERVVRVYLEPGANLRLECLPPHQAAHAGEDEIVITFQMMTLSALIHALATLAKMDGVVDLEFSRTGLHGAYVDSVSSHSRGKEDGSSRR